MITPSSITLSDLAALEKATTETSLAIRRIRIASERGDISPEKAAKQLKHIGIFIKPKHTQP